MFNRQHFALLHLGRGSSARGTPEIHDAPGLVEGPGGDEAEVHALAAARARDELKRGQALGTI